MEVPEIYVRRARGASFAMELNGANSRIPEGIFWHHRCGASLRGLGVAIPFVPPHGEKLEGGKLGDRVRY